MLKLVTNLRRAIGGSGHHLRYLCQYSSTQLVGNYDVLAPPLWHQVRILHHHQHLDVASNAKLGFIVTRARLIHRKAPSSASCPNLRGLATASSPESASGTPGTGFIAWYLQMLSTHPLPTKSVTAGSILGLADVTGQCLANMALKEGEPKQEWDKMRTLRMLGIGAFISAPFLHLWFNVMQRLLPGSDVASTVKKVAAGQFLASPVVNCVFFAVNSFLQGESVEQAIEKIKRDLWPTWKSGAMYWPILDFITFRFIKIHLQVFFNNCCSFIWTIYLTSMASKKPDATPKGNLNKPEPC